MVGRELVGDGPEAEVGRAGGLFLAVMGGRETVVEELVVVFWTGWRTEADLPSPKTPEMGLLRGLGAPLSSILLPAIEAARVRRVVDEVDEVGDGPLRGSLLGERLRALLRLSESVSFFCLNSPPAGFRRDRDRVSNEDMAMRSYVELRCRVVSCGCLSFVDVAWRFEPAPSYRAPVEPCSEIGPGSGT